MTFALHCGNSTDEMLTGDHLSPIETKLVNIDKKLKDLIVETKFSYKRQETHYNSTLFCIT